MIKIDGPQAREYRMSGFSKLEFNKLANDLKKIDIIFKKRFNFHIGEEVILVKSYFSKQKNKNMVLDDKYFDACSPYDFCVFFVAGWCPQTKSIILARFFNDSTYPHHYKIKNPNFIKPTTCIKAQLDMQTRYFQGANAKCSENESTSELLMSQTSAIPIRNQKS